MQSFLHRIKPVREFIDANKLDAALVMEPADRRYLCGFTGSTGYVLITPEKQYFLADFRYVEQASQQCVGYEIVSITGEDDMFRFLSSHKLQRLALETSFVSMRLECLLREQGMTCAMQIDDVIKRSRMIKEPEEFAWIKRACEITEIAFNQLLPEIHAGMKENDIDFLLQMNMRRYPEVERMAEKFIVASGERGSLPHGIASERVIREGDMITMDFGCNCGGYWSDVSRTVCIGKASERQREIYDITWKAQHEAILFAAAGKTGRQVDRAARDIIADAGYGENFGHGLGHSFGLDIHENPRCAQNQAGDIVLEPGMIITIEPGIYLPGQMGVRIEDDLLITETGNSVLSYGDTHDLIEI